MDDTHLTPSPLRRARERLGLSMAQLATLAEVPKPSLQRWENGTLPTIVVALRLAAVLGTTVEALWGDAMTSLPESPADAATEHDDPEGPVVVRDGFDQTGAGA